MSYGIEIYDENGVRTLGMADFTYSKIFETDIPAGSSNYNITVPGYSDANCIVVFTPVSYVTGAQSGSLPTNGSGFVPLYRSPGGEVVTVVRGPSGQAYDPGNQRFVTVYGRVQACRMEVFKIFGSN